MNMSKILVFIFTKSLLYFSASSKHRQKRQSRIVGGYEAAPHSHPYMVSIQIRVFGWSNHVCGGSILNEYWVLTAAHCIDDFIISWLPLDVIAGAHDLNNLGPTAQIRRVKDRIVHPLHHGQVANDIAVIRTDTRFEFTKTVQPVHLPRKFDLRPNKLVAPGWGALKIVFIFPKMPGILQELNVTYVPFKECRLVVDFLLNRGRKENEKVDNPLDEEKNICTGPLLKKTSMCSGDSGGPLVQYLSSRKYYERNVKEKSKGIYEVKIERIVPVIVGIVSWTISPWGRFL